MIVKYFEKFGLFCLLWDLNAYSYAVLIIMYPLEVGHD
jgi:hypothetical protein